ncbi:MAG: hypothetical protein NOU37_08235 [Candidatus Brocadiales bacterium]|nr:hypothetical protein [Candidatus Bathyanammoxibius amoris]
MKNVLTKDVDPLFLVKGRNRKLLEEVEQFFKTLPLGHSRYQIKNFIIGQFEKSSADRAHRQCLTEINTRYHSLLDMHYQYRKTELEIKTEEVNVRERDYKLENVVSDQFERERLELSIETSRLEVSMKEWGLLNIKKAIGETMREITQFKEEMDRLAPQRKFPGNYEQAEPEYWQGEFLRRFVQGNRGENLPQIPEAEKERLIESLQERVKQLEDNREGAVGGH